MKIPIFRMVADTVGISFLLMPLLAWAQGPTPEIFLNACWGGTFFCDNLSVVANNFAAAFFFASGGIALALFLVGAFLMTISGGNDTNLQKGKTVMSGSLIGLSIIVGSYAIYRTMIFLLY